MHVLLNVLKFYNGNCSEHITNSKQNNNGNCSEHITNSKQNNNGNCSEHINLGMVTLSIYKSINVGETFSVVIKTMTYIKAKTCISNMQVVYILRTYLSL